jgi:hypothetical protein
MYLIHETDDRNVLNIIKSEKILSNYDAGNINYGEGIYKYPNKFVFFTTIKNPNKIKIIKNTAIFVFSSSILKHSNFYLSESHLAHPEKSENTKIYKKGHNETFINNKLLNLYNNAKLRAGTQNKMLIPIYHQIAYERSADFVFLTKIILHKEYHFKKKNRKYNKVKISTCRNCIWTHVTHPPIIY